jgi:RNA polymerase sigma-70 factor (ECF subfamily)
MTTHTAIDRPVGGTSRPGWEVLAESAPATVGDGPAWPWVDARPDEVTGDTDDERRRAFEEEALVHVDLLYNSAVQMTRNVADAQDLVQETFVKAFRFFDKYERGTNCKAWLFRIMKNSFINNFRRRSREPGRVDFNEIEPMLKATPEKSVASTNGGTDIDRVFEELVEDDVKHAVDQLPFDFRMVVVLSDVEGLSYQEIADVMECPIGTVRSRLSRARRFLQTKLRDFARERGIIG